MCSLIFVLMLHIEFQVPSSGSSLVLQPTKGVMDKRTDGQTDGPKPKYAPSISSKLGGIKNMGMLIFHMERINYIMFQSCSQVCFQDTAGT